MKSVLKYIIWLYFLAIWAYVAYGWYSYTGLYRLAAEWQLEYFGSYSFKLTLLVPLVILAIPGAVLARLFGVQAQLRGANSFTGSPGMFALLGVAGLAIAV